MKALITRKLGMTSTIAEDGSMSAITLLLVTPNIVTQIKNTDNDGYQAIQVGCEDSNKLPKPQLGHVKKSKTTPKILREFRIEDKDNELSIGDKLTADVFSVGDSVDVIGTSKGKGFAGTVKRHNFSIGRKSHGGRNQRRPGSIGSMYPQKIFKGKKMAGQMGNERVTVKNLKIAYIDNENKVVGVSGAVPGPKKCIVMLRGVE